MIRYSVPQSSATLFKPWVACGNRISLCPCVLISLIWYFILLHHEVKFFHIAFPSIQLFRRPNGDRWWRVFRNAYPWLMSVSWARGSYPNIRYQPRKCLAIPQNSGATLNSIRGTMSTNLFLQESGTLWINLLLTKDLVLLSQSNILTLFASCSIVRHFFSP